MLTADGHLREYDVSEDAEEPQQTINLARPAARDRSERASSSVSFGLDDDDEEMVASSFCFGTGDADWGLLTLFYVLRNGDIHALCPYLPKRSCVVADRIGSCTQHALAELRRSAAVLRRLQGQALHRFSAAG